MTYLFSSGPNAVTIVATDVSLGETGCSAYYLVCERRRPALLLAAIPMRSDAIDPNTKNPAPRPPYDFATSTVSYWLDSGVVVLSSTPDSSGQWFVQDQLRVDVTDPTGKTRTFTHDGAAARVVLASNTDGTGPLSFDLEIEIKVDGGWSYQYGVSQGEPNDITYMFAGSAPCATTVTLTLTVSASATSYQCSDIYLVTLPEVGGSPSARPPLTQR